jgi:SNF2 family DNA or RNA helicase
MMGQWCKQGCVSECLACRQHRLRSTGFNRPPKMNRTLMTASVKVNASALRSETKLSNIPFVAPCFSLKDRVRLKAQPRRRGRVVETPRPYNGGFEYLVMLAGEDEGWFPESALELLPNEDFPRRESREEFLRDLLLAKLQQPLSDSLYAYRASKTVFEPYQFRPALKFLRSPEQRILIADEVGLGKTIEAAIIYLELKARTNVERVLVLCPSRLKGKWQDELRNRFDEEFIDLDAAQMRRILEDFGHHGLGTSFRAIASFETLRREQFIDALVEQKIPLDLLIVDEAHYMRNADTATYRLGMALTDNADAAVFLTATPLHLRNTDLYNLLHLLAPGDYQDASLFDEQVRPNAHINRAARLLASDHTSKALTELRYVEQTTLRERFLRNPYYRDVVERLHSWAITNPTMDERINLQRDLLDLNTLSSIFSRTRKREVSHAAVRAAYSINVRLSPAERAFYDGIVNLVRHDLRSAGRGAPAFAIIARERMAASCLAATREAFEEGVSSRRAVSLNQERSVFDTETTEEDPRLELNNGLVALSRSIGTADAKFDQFELALREALADLSDSKALVFSFFRRTLDYLKRRLQTLGYEVDVIHGGVPIVERKRIIERFRVEPTMRVLLSSEVGAEGLDFQFCDVLFNYDLPWNPMQVEQRIGRLDRFGQQHERIRIYNLYIEDTIETRIFQRLYDRINIFEQSIGDLEAILGEVITELSRAALQSQLTPGEQATLAEQAATRIFQQQRAAEELEREKDHFLGQDEIFDQQVLSTIQSGRTIVGEEIAALINTFIAARFPRVHFACDHEEPCWTLKFDRDLSNDLGQFIREHRYENRVGDQFMRALQDFGRVAITTDSELARQRPNLEFITVRHPLAEAARAYWHDKGLTGIPATRIAVNGVGEERGSGYFFVYILTVTGSEFADDA